MSAYTEFVGRYMREHAGQAKQTSLMKAAAAAWRAHRGGGVMRKRRKVVGVRRRRRMVRGGGPLGSILGSVVGHLGSLLPF